MAHTQFQNICHLHVYPFDYVCNATRAGAWAAEVEVSKMVFGTWLFF